MRQKLAGLLLLLLHATSQAAAPQTQAGSSPVAHSPNQDRRSIKMWGASCDGLADDSPAMAQAASDTRDTGSRVFIPADCKIKMGGAAQVWMRGMAFEGDGVRDYGPVMGRHGGLILLTDQTKSPFLVSDSWSMSGLEFFWPDQAPLRDGPPLRYPALIVPHANNPVVLASFTNNQVVNAYDLIDLTSAEIAGHLHIEANSIYVLHYAINLRSVGGETWLNNNQFSPIAWYPVINQGAMNKTIAWSVANSEAVRVVGNGTAAVASSYTVDGLTSANNYFLLLSSALHIFGGRADLLQWDGNGLDGLSKPILVDAGGSIEGSMTGGQINQAWSANGSYTGCAIDIAPGSGPDNGLSITGVDITGALGSAFCVTDVGNSRFSITGGSIWNVAQSKTDGKYPAIYLNTTGTLSVVGVQLRNTVARNDSASIVIQTASAVAITGNTLTGWSSALQMNSDVRATTFVANAIFGERTGNHGAVTGPGARSVVSIGNAEQ